MKAVAYPSYKDSGVEWLGNVPTHWEVKKVKYIVSRKTEKCEDVEDSQLPYVGLEHIESWIGRLLPLDLEFVPSGTSNKFSRGDILFGKLRPYLAKACLVDFDGLCTSEIIVLNPRGQNQHYLLYCLLTSGFISLVDSSTYGAKMPRAEWDFIGGCILPLPPLKEQDNLTNFLIQKTAKLDLLIAKKKTLIEKLQEKRTALISRTVTHGLPPDAARAAGLDPNPKLKSSGIDWLGDVPEHWCVKKISYGFKKIGSGTTPKSDLGEYYDGEIPWVTTSELRENIITDTKQKVTQSAINDFSSLRLYPEGTVLFAMYGATIGRLGILGIPATVNQACCALAEPTLFEPRFIFYWLWMRRPILVSLSTGGGQPNLSQDDLRQIRLAFPPSINEQKIIAKYIDQENSKIDNLISEVNLVIVRLQEYRASLITAAVTGKIDVQGMKV